MLLFFLLHQPNIFAPELTTAKTKGDNMKSLSLFTKNVKNSPFRSHTLLFYVYAVKIIYGLELYLARKVSILLSSSHKKK